MPWQIIHSRDRSLFVRGAESGAPTFTRQPALALRFDTQDQARKWIERNTLSAFGELALLREPRIDKKNPAQAGQPGGVNSKVPHESTATLCRRA